MRSEIISELLGEDMFVPKCFKRGVTWMLGPIVCDACALGVLQVLDTFLAYKQLDIDHVLHVDQIWRGWQDLSQLHLGK